MPILFAGNRATDFEVAVNTARVTSSTLRHPDFVDAIYLLAADAVLRTRLKAAATTNIWTTFYAYADTPHSSPITSVRWGTYSLWPLDSLNPLRLEFSRTALKLVVNGVVVATLAVPAAEHVLARYDVRIKLHASTGLFECYKDGVLVLQWEGNTLPAGLTQVDAFTVIGGTMGFNNFTISGIIVSTSDTRTLQIAPMYLTGNGTNQEWDGDYTDINDATHDASDFIETNILDEESTYLFSKPATPVGHNISAIIVSGAMNHYGEDVDGIEAIYYDGVDTVSLGAFPNLEVLFAGSQVISEINPATGVKYTDAELAAFEFGFKSV